MHLAKCTLSKITGWLKREITALNSNLEQTGRLTREVLRKGVTNAPMAGPIDTKAGVFHEYVV